MNGNRVKAFIFVHGHDLGAVARQIFAKINEGFVCHGTPFVLKDGAVCQAMYLDEEDVSAQYFREYDEAMAKAKADGQA